MFVDFDINEKLNVVSILEFLQDGTKKISSYNLKTKKLIGEIDNNYLPLGPRLSPNEEFLAFFSNDHSLYLWDIKNDYIKAIFDQLGLNAGFCEWSTSGKQLCFSAYSNNPKKNTTPCIYLLNLENQKVVQLTEGAGVDRFPQWSPSNQFIAFHRQYLNEPNTPKRIHILDISQKMLLKIPQSTSSNYLIGKNCWSNHSSHILIKEGNNDDVSLKAFHIPTMKVDWTFTYPDIVGGAFLIRNNNIFVVCKKETLIVSFPGGRDHSKTSSSK